MVTEQKLRTMQRYASLSALVHDAGGMEPLLTALHTEDHVVILDSREYLVAPRDVLERAAYQGARVLIA